MIRTLFGVLFWTLAYGVEAMWEHWLGRPDIPCTCAGCAREWSDQ